MGEYSTRKRTKVESITFDKEKQFADMGIGEKKILLKEKSLKFDEHGKIILKVF